MVNRDLEKLFFFQNALKMSVTTIQCGQMRVLKLLILWLYVLATSTCCSLKTNPHFLQFSRLNIQFPDFFHAWKIALQISRLFQEFKTLYEPHDYCNSRGGGGVSTETNLCCFVSASRLYLTSLTSDFSTSKAPSRSLTLSWTKRVK